MNISTDQFYLDNSTDVPVVRWKSNNNIPPKECIAYMFKQGWITWYEVENSNEVRAEETSKFLSDYAERMKNYVPSDEERYEMEAAFGKGAKVVDVISGVVTVI